MIEALKPYSAYRDSGLPGLGDVPSHWEIAPGFGAYREKHVCNLGLHEMTILSLSYGKIIVKSCENLTGLVPESFETYQIVDAGDIVIHPTDLQNDKTSLRVGIVRNRGIITSAYLALKTTEKLLPTYGYFLLHTLDLIKLLYGLGSGMRQNLSYGDFKRLPVFAPPLEEQVAIVRFLDCANARLERTIRAKRKVIALLNEQKQAIIHRAVTRGLDPNVPLKPSGVPWLGDIPGSWAVLRAKFLFKEIDDRSVSGSEELLSVSHITGVTPRSQKNITMFKAESYSGHKLCRSGDLVINTMWAWMGALGTASETGIVSPAYAVYRQRKAGLLKPLYIDSLLRTRLYIDEFMRRSTGIRSSRLRLYPEEFFKVEILVPPLVEQEEILRSISKQTGNLNKSINKVSAEIDLLREYRTRLIADVVTGKLDVRDAAAKLPVEEVIAPVEDDPLAEEDALEDELTEPVA